MTGDKLRDRKAASIAVDKDNPEWTKADFARAKPASEVLGAKAAALLVRGRGRPAKAPGERKRQVTLRLAPDILEAARASGSGWQVRAEEVLRREFLDKPIATRTPRADPIATRTPRPGAVIRLGKLLGRKAAKPGGGKKRA